MRPLGLSLLPNLRLHALDTVKNLILRILAGLLQKNLLLKCGLEYFSANFDWLFTTDAPALEKFFLVGIWSDAPRFGFFLSSPYCADCLTNFYFVNIHVSLVVMVFQVRVHWEILLQLIF